MVRVTGVQVPSTRAKHAFERRVTVPHHSGPWVWREVQAQLLPYAPPDTIRELELARPDGRYVISIGLLNPQPNPCRVNTRVSFAMGSWVCGDAFLLAKEYHEPYWLTRSFTMSDWEQLNLLLKAVATPDTPFFDLEQCAYLVSMHTHHLARPGSLCRSRWRRGPHRPGQRADQLPATNVTLGPGTPPSVR